MADSVWKGFELEGAWLTAFGRGGGGCELEGAWVTAFGRGLS